MKIEKISYDFIADLMIIDRAEYSLSSYRKWLVMNHEQLCQGNFIKSLTILGKTKKYFDWQTIYHIAFEYKFLNNYLHELSTRPTD